VIWLVIFVALLIPLTAVVLDSPVVRAWVDRRHGGAPEIPPEVEDLTRKVGVLESEIEALTRQLGQVQEEQQFLQRLLEDPTQRQAAAAKLPRPQP
jgi:hypothetical protein